MHANSHTFLLQSILKILVLYSRARSEVYGIGLLAIPKLRTRSLLSSSPGKTSTVTCQELPCAQNKCLQETQPFEMHYLYNCPPIPQTIYLIYTKLT